MVLKSNRLQKLEKAADRRQHFGIRKLTIGAASVLLGTTLWLGRDAINVQAASQDNEAKDGSNDADQATESKVETPKIDDKTQVEVQAQPSAGQVNAPSEGTISAPSSSQTNASIKADAGAQQDIEQNKAAADETAANSNKEQNQAATSTERANAALNQAAIANQKAANAKQAGKFVADAAAQEVEHTVNSSENNSHVQKFDINKLDLSQGASQAGLSTDSNLGAKNFLANLQAVKANGSNKDAVLQTNTGDSRNVNSNENSDSLISGANSAINGGKAAASEIKQVVVQKASEDKVADTLSQGDAALKAKAAIIDAGKNDANEYVVKGLKSFLAPNELNQLGVSLAEDYDDGKLQPNTMEGGKGYQYTTKDGITFADDPAYPNPYNNIPDTEYAFWEGYFGDGTQNDGPNYPLVLTTDRKPGSDTTAGKVIHYYYRDKNGRFHNGTFSSTNTSQNFGFSINQYTVLYLQDPKSHYASTVIWPAISSSEEPDMYAEYGSGHVDKKTADDISTRYQGAVEPFGIYTANPTSLTVKYVDESGNPIIIGYDAKGNPVSSVTEYGMDHQYYDATGAITRTIKGTTSKNGEFVTYVPNDPKGKVTTDSAPVKSILDARKKGVRLYYWKYFWKCWSKWQYYVSSPSY